MIHQPLGARAPLLTRQARRAPRFMVGHDVDDMAAVIGADAEDLARLDRGQDGEAVHRDARFSARADRGDAAFEFRPDILPCREQRTRVRWRWRVEGIDCSIAEQTGQNRSVRLLKTPDPDRG